MSYEFTREKIDHKVETFGVVVQPAVDPTADRVQIQNFYNLISEQFPELFDTLAQGRQQFEIKKRVSIPPRGHLEVTTFSVTPRGPVFTFPRKLPFLPDDIPWPRDLNDKVVQCIEMFKKCLVMARYHRAGKRWELVFPCDGEDAAGILRERFASKCPEGAKDIFIRWNQPCEHYNQLVEVCSVVKQNVVTQNVGGVAYPRQDSAGTSGIRVVLDVQNRVASKTFGPDEIRIIWNHADQVFNDALFKILNGK